MDGKGEMRVDEARQLLGFPAGIRPTPSQIKEAYRRKALETHPDRFPANEKSHAESKFKKISEAYSCLQDGARRQHSEDATYSRVVRTGVPKAYGRSSSSALVKVPFFLLIFGTVGLGGLNASRAYRRQREMCPSHNPFLP